MTEHFVLRLRGSPRLHRSTASGRGGPPARASLACLGCAGLLAWIGYSSMGTDLRQEGEDRQTRPTGPCSCSTRSPASPSPWCCWRGPCRGRAACCSGDTAATLGALLISLSAGLSGFRESISASDVTEIPGHPNNLITVPVGLGWTVRRQPSPGRTARGCARQPSARPRRRRRGTATGSAVRLDARSTGRHLQRRKQRNSIRGEVRRQAPTQSVATVRALFPSLAVGSWAWTGLRTHWDAG